MRKTILFFAVMMVASGSAYAVEKKAKGVKPKPAAEVVQPVNPNDAGFRLVRDGFPLILPTAVQAIYFSTQSGGDKKPAVAKKK